MIDTNTDTFGDGPLAGVLLNLYDNHNRFTFNANLFTFISSTATDVNGCFKFPALSAGHSYVVQEIDPNGLINVFDSTGRLNNNYIAVFSSQFSV